MVFCVEKIMSMSVSMLCLYLCLCCTSMCFVCLFWYVDREIIYVRNMGCDALSEFPEGDGRVLGSGMVCMCGFSEDGLASVQTYMGMMKCGTQSEFHECML
jgi:hypothetical protein